MFIFVVRGYIANIYNVTFYLTALQLKRYNRVDYNVLN